MNDNISSGSDTPPNTPVHSTQQKNSKLIIIAVSIVGAIVILIMGFFALNSYIRHQELSGGNQKQNCTLEAKICPDGSSVGRTMPNCEFAACPGS